MYAQLRDNSQGVIKITSGAAGRDAAAAEITVERETKLSGAPAAAAQPLHALHCVALARRWAKMSASARCLLSVALTGRPQRGCTGG